MSKKLDVIFWINVKREDQAEFLGVYWYEKKKTTNFINLRVFDLTWVSIVALPVQISNLFLMDLKRLASIAV